MDKKYIEDKYHLAVLDFKTARDENEQWEARKTMARLEQIAMQEYGFAYADNLHGKEVSGNKMIEVIIYDNNKCSMKQADGDAGMAHGVANIFRTLRWAM